MKNPTRSFDRCARSLLQAPTRCVRISSLCRASVSVILLATLYSVGAGQGKIVYENNSGGGIFTADPDGTNVTQVSADLNDSAPSINSDGTKIVFVGADRQLYTMNTDGSGRTRITSDPASKDNPRFSRDGTRIVAASSGFATPPTITVTGANGANLITFALPSLRLAFYPSFTADGSKIVFSCNDLTATNFVSDICEVSTDGTGLTHLTATTGIDEFQPIYSPDGSKLFFGSCIYTTQLNCGIEVMDADGSNRVAIAPYGTITFFSHFALNPDGTKIVFTSYVNGYGELFTMNSDGTDRIRITNTPTVDEFWPSWGGSPRRPVMIIPGIAGTYSAFPQFDLGWLLKRGELPAGLQIDPLVHAYDDVIKTFENLGYVRDKDLFVVNYDWRLEPGPLDYNIDGVVSGISASSISDQTFEYGVDYLGNALRRAAERWELDHPGLPLAEVDVVAHSTGGLVARTYIQSPAYNSFYSEGKKLPAVKNMVMVGVPNRGASKAWNPIHDNWNADKAYKYVLSKIIARAYMKVVTGSTVTGPDHDIWFGSILDDSTPPLPNHEKLIAQYVPTMKALLATYDFIDFGSGYTNVNLDPQLSNRWLLDLNNGLDLYPTTDASPFAEFCEPTVIYATGRETPGFVRKNLLGGDDVLFRFSNIQAEDVAPGTPWYEEIPAFSRGDGTVPTLSAMGQFAGDPRVTLKEVVNGNPDHLQLMSTFDGQSAILEALGLQFSAAQIHTGSYRMDLANIVSVILDPVDGFVVDGAGRRLGYSDATGPVTEIPGSVWFGNSDGAGWIFGPVQLPLRLELTGRGEPYQVHVAVHTPDGDGGVTDSGFLSLGEGRSLPIIIGTPPPMVCPHGQGYWKNNPDLWPVDSLDLGSQSYSKSELQHLLNLPIGVGTTADASLILARQLIAVKLNTAHGAGTTPLGTSVPEADALLGSFSGRLPYAVQPSTPAGQAMVEKAALFENFNNGALTNGCGL